MPLYGFFSDVHGNVAALSAVLTDLRERGVERAFCLGDLVGYGSGPNGVIDLVRRAGIATLMGNYDEGVGFERGECGCFYATPRSAEVGRVSYDFTVREVTPENKSFLRNLPREAELELGGVRLHLVHGSPRANNEYLTEHRDTRTYERLARAESADVLLFGHTHEPWHHRHGGVLFVNVGSVGWPKDGDPRAAYTVLQTGASGPESLGVEVVRVSYDSEQTAQAVLERGLPEELAECFRRGVGLS